METKLDQENITEKDVKNSEQLDERYNFNLKDFILAANHLQSIMPEADFETEAEIQYWIGKSYYEMGHFEKAIYEFLKVKIESHAHLVLNTGFFSLETLVLSWLDE